jgi:signal transduction histidine kinase
VTRRSAIAHILLLGTTVAVVGLISTRIGYATFEFRYAVLALLTGWLVAACGLAAWIREPVSRTGPLLVLVALTWFIGGFRWVLWEPAAELAATLDLLYLGVASHAILTFPTGRSGSLAVRMIVAAGYAASVVPAPRADVIVAVVLLIGIGGVAWRLGGGGRDQRRVLVSGAIFALATAGHRLVPATVGGLAWLDTRPIVLIALSAAALTLAVPLIRRHGGAARAADLVVELESSPRAELMRDLGELVGDPQVRLGMWYAAGGHFVDALGGPVEEPTPGSGRIATRIVEGGEPLAVLVHATDTVLDPAVLAAVRTAARLSVDHARLQADVRAQVLAVRASRRRLLVAGDEERARLETTLRASLDPSIAALEGMLRSPMLREDHAATTAIQHLAETRIELDALIAGIGPPALELKDMTAAFDGLAASSPVPLAIRVEIADIPSRETRSALVFVAREGLANIGKHAMATTASLRLTSQDGVVRLEVSDDGRGGAEMGNGSGLEGLRDRVEALGGQLTLTSRAGAGTRLSASLPLEDPAW